MNYLEDMNYAILANVQLDNSLIMQILALFSAVILAYFAFRKDDKTVFVQTLEVLHSENIKLKQEVSVLKEEVYKLRAELDSAKLNSENLEIEKNDNNK